MTLLAGHGARTGLGGSSAPFDPPRSDDVTERRQAPRGAADRTHRVIVVLSAIGVLGPAFATWSGIVTVPLTGLASVLLTAGSLTAVVCAAAVRTERGLHRVELGVLALGVVALAAWALGVVAANPAYGTDEAAFEQYAAHLLLNGLDPYAHSLLPALREFRVPIQYATYTTSGGVVSTLGYPGLSVLLVVPFMWLTGGVQAVPVLDVVALAVSMVIAFFVLPRRFRALAVVVVVGLPILFGYAVAGVNVILAMPFLLVVAWRFTETGAGGRLGRRGLLQAVCLGLAVSVQQIAWFIAPFVLVGLWAARRQELARRDVLGVMGRYAGIAAGSFALVNAAFVAAGPGVWLKGVLEPLLQHAIPYGQGLIDLPVFAGLGGGDLGLYTYAAIGLLAGLLVCLRLFYTTLWRCTFVLPSLALFFPTRSLAEYWMTLVLVWTVSLFASPPGSIVRAGLPASATDGWGARLRRGRVLAAALAFVPGLALLSLALSTPSPLAIEVVGVRTNGQYERVWELALRVTNRSRERLDPHFATNSIGQMTSFWHRMSGPRALGPGETARYRLAAPNVGAMPGITQPFQIDAVTNAPQSISVTGNTVTQPYRVWIYQSYVNKVLPAGAPVTLRVQLRSPLGARVDKAGVRVELGQVVYGQSSLIPGEARIDGRAVGRSPVTMRTDASGQATFRITDSNPQGQPVYFQAWTVSRSGYPFGYSEIVDVLWSGR